MSKLDLSPEGLLPCPFCGGSAHVVRQGTAKVSQVVECENCGCSLETGETFVGPGISWNRRALATERRSDFLAGALAMREAAARECDDLHRLYYMSADVDAGGAAYEAASAIRAIDPASLTEKPVASATNASREQFTQKATCETHGHIFGHRAVCVFCKTPKQQPTIDRPKGSNADEWAMFIEDWCGPVQARDFMAVQIAEAIEAAQQRQPVAPVVDDALVTALRPFAKKASDYEARHHGGRYPVSDSTQITHRLGDFRAARAALEAALKGEK